MNALSPNTTLYAAPKLVTPRLLANAIRFLSMDAIERAQDGHPGTPLGAAEIVTALFTRHLKFVPRHPLWPDRDRFVQSNGHGSMLLYSLLYLSGYEKISIEEIMRFRELGSHCAGHPEFDPYAGIEVTTGPLGQGIANAAGMAVAEAFLNHWFGPEIIDHHTYCLVGDGCLQEGIGQEIISLAGHLRLGKFIVLWDDNHITDDGTTDQALSEDNRERFKLSGWQVINVDGHEVESVSAGITAAKRDARPSMIACTTKIGRGVPRLEGQRVAHGGRVFKEDTDAARKALGWPFPPFEIPESVLSAWRAAGVRARPAFDAWRQRVAAMPPDKRREYERLREGRIPEGVADALVAFKKKMAAERPSQPSIRTSGEIVDILYDLIPELMGGAPDLEAATQHKKKARPFTKFDHGGHYIHYGVREHAMGAMMNGMAAHKGLVPFGVTFLVFSDYERPAMRMAAMMGLPTLFVFSHDSIGIAKNGPTHQPIEMLASLRAIPNMLVLRPADAVEAAECWDLALKHRDRPSSLIFSRQPLEPVRLEHTDENLARRGAYVLHEAEGGPRRVTLIGTGSEVAIAVKARAQLQAEGIPTAVVSMPCWELFEMQDEAYRNAVIDRATVRVAVEAACKLGWERWIGEAGAFVGMSGFGASGPYDQLYEHFGITPARVAAEAKARL